MEEGFFGEGFLLGMGGRWVGVLVGEALELAIVLLDFFLAESVDDLGSGVHAPLEEPAFDFIGVWFELEERDLRSSGESFHGGVREVGFCWGLSFN